MIICPRCDKPLEERDYNTGTGCAFCRSCAHAFRLEKGAEIPFDLNSPPRRIRILSDGMHETMQVRHYTHASWFFLIFAFVWSSGSLPVTVLTLMSMKETVAWGMLLFMLPFDLIGIGFLLYALFLLLGRTEFRPDEEGLSIFRGIGSIGRRIRFSWDEITGIEVEQVSRKSEDTADRYVLILRRVNDKKKLFASGEMERLHFMSGFLRKYFKRYRKWKSI